MNREILFRGERVDSGQNVYGFYRKAIARDKLNDNFKVLYTKHFIGKIDDKELFDDIFQQVEVTEESVSQFTGFVYDGVKLFENDNVRQIIESEYLDESDWTVINGTVKMIDGRWCVGSSQYPLDNDFKCN